jgi:enhancing lycopene biosynthesis protein 2
VDVRAARIAAGEADAVARERRKETPALVVAGALEAARGVVDVDHRQPHRDIGEEPPQLGGLVLARVDCPP